MKDKTTETDPTRKARRKMTKMTGHTLHLLPCGMAWCAFMPALGFVVPAAKEAPLS